MAPLLDRDETLMAVSAWNDNGQVERVKVIDHPSVLMHGWLILMLMLTVCGSDGFKAVRLCLVKVVKSSNPSSTLLATLCVDTCFRQGLSDPRRLSQLQNM